METWAAQQLKQLAFLPEPEINLAEAAFWIARTEYPELDVRAYMARLDAMGERMLRRLPSDAAPTARILTLNHYLFEELGYSGNATNYYDPRNSYLNQVLDRKTGIPITLCVLYLELGRRLGLALQGISFPGHFLVKLPMHGGSVVLDPFAGGVSLSGQDIEMRLKAFYGTDLDEQMPPLHQFLAAAGKREILLRLLRNLKGIYLQSHQLEKALATLNSILVIDPNLGVDVLDRGAVLQKLKCYQAAAADFQHYLELEPAAPHAALLRDRVAQLRGLASRLN